MNGLREDAKSPHKYIESSDDAAIEIIESRRRKAEQLVAFILLLRYLNGHDNANDNEDDKEY